MKKKHMMLAAMAVSVCLAFSGCTTQNTESKAESTTAAESMEESSAAESTAQIPSPFVAYDTLAEAEAAVGFKLNVPDTFDEYENRTIQVMDGKMLEVIYENADGAEGLRIRKEKGSEDISGDYNTYEETDTETINGKDVSLAGNSGTVSLATWQADGYSYAVSAQEAPLTQEEMEALLAPID